MARVYSKRDRELRGQPAKETQARPQSRREHFAAAARIEIRYATPEEALRLNEDAFALSEAHKLVRSVDPLNIMDTLTQGERDTARELQRNLLSSLRNWERYARQKLAREHLIGEHRPEQKRSGQP